MKKIYTIVILIAFGITQIYAQPQPCLQCTGTTASGYQATSVGTNTTAGGDNSFAGGASSTANGDNSFVFGFNSTIDGDGSIGLGTQVNTQQDHSFAIGRDLTSSALSSYLFGRYLTSTGSNSITMGIGASGSPLTNSKNNSLMFGVSSLPSLTIVKPTGGADIGYLGIGTEEPEELVHVKEGKLLIESTEQITSGLQFKHPNTRDNNIPPNDSIIAPPYYWDIYSDASGLRFNTMSYNGGTGNQQMIIGRSGMVGIGVTPKAKLHVSQNILADGDIVTLDKFVLKPASNSKLEYWEVSRTSTGLKYTYVDRISQDFLFIGNNGFIGIGKTNPTETLDVNGSFKANSATIAGTLTSNTADITTLTANTADITTLTANTASIDMISGNTKVNGRICAKEVVVSLDGLPCWPDYVFQKDYKLLPLVELEQFITENQHLPNVPSAAEVEANGVELGEMNAILLQKVEELTLYILDLQKQINELKKQ